MRKNRRTVITNNQTNYKAKLNKSTYVITHSFSHVAPNNTNKTNPVKPTTCNHPNLLHLT